MDKIKTVDLFDLGHTLAGDFLAGFTYPWEALPEIAAFVEGLTGRLPADYRAVAPGVWAHESVRIFEGAHLFGPCVIGPGSEVRPGAFIRGAVLIGANAVVGNSCEFKNCFVFDGAQVPHFNYVGDSILGHKAHMGAGAVTSNVKGDKTNVVVHGEQAYETGRKKFGAMLGDFTEVGCNSVLNPGTILGRRAQVYPLSCVRGVVPEDMILKGERGLFPKIERTEG